MRTVVTQPSAERPGRQRITNMEKLVPELRLDETEMTAGLSEFADKITLVLAPDVRSFIDWRRRQAVPLNRLRQVMSVQDLHGYAPGSVEIVELPDWHLSMSYNEGQWVERALEALQSPQQPLAGRNASGRKVPPQSPTSPSISRSSVITVDGSTGLSRVRIGRTKERKGAYDGDPLDVVTTQYLDGKALRVSSTRKYFQEDEVAFDAVPARTKDITDFGRLTTAAKSLAVSMAAFGPDNEPSSEQLAVFIAGYRNLLEWRRKVRQQMTRAEGEIDAVETLLTQIL